jgi:response regulator RpfG family c-di-GMP phosphodiesterase
MPNMDGFELTQTIRCEESAASRLPIIAVTGNAMRGEAQRCLTAGMDDYLSKPLRMHELGAMLAKWLPVADHRDPSAPGSELRDGQPVSADLPTWDATTLGTLVGDNQVMHRRLLEKFLQTAPEKVEAIGVAIAAVSAARLQGWRTHSNRPRVAWVLWPSVNSASSWRRRVTPMMRVLAAHRYRRFRLPL